MFCFPGDVEILYLFYSVIYDIINCPEFLGREDGQHTNLINKIKYLRELMSLLGYSVLLNHVAIWDLLRKLRLLVSINLGSIRWEMADVKYKIVIVTIDAVN